MAEQHKKRPNFWTYSCALCKKDHAIKTCTKFLNLSPAERFDVVCAYYYCINCLAISHTRNVCKTDLTCQVCHESHNTLLHFSPQLKEYMAKSKDGNFTPPLRHDKAHTSSSSRPSRTVILDNKTRKRPSPSRERETRPKSIVRVQPNFKLQPDHVTSFTWSRTFRPTALIRIATSNEPRSWHMCRTGLNSYAPVSRISTRLQRDLKLETFTFGNHTFAKFEISGRLDKFKWNKDVRALVTDTLPITPYSKPLEEDPTTAFSKDTLADPDPRCNLPIDLELGSEEFYNLYRNGSINSEVKYVWAQLSAIGYIFTGSIGKPW